MAKKRNFTEKKKRSDNVVASVETSIEDKKLGF